jgi:hypothetical protein
VKEGGGGRREEEGGGKNVPSPSNLAGHIQFPLALMWSIPPSNFTNIMFVRASPTVMRAIEGGERRPWEKKS